MPMVTSPQAAQIIDKTQRMVQYLVTEGKLKATRITDRHIMLIDLDDLRATAAKEGYTFNEEIAAQFVN